MKDLASIGDTVDISTTKDAVKFSTSGDIGTANVTVRSAAHTCNGHVAAGTSVGAAAPTLMSACYGKSGSINRFTSSRV